MFCSARRRGVTVLEALITLLLVFLLVGLAAGLAREYASVVRFSDRQDSLIAVAQTGLERVRAELAGAQSVAQPSGGGPVPTLEFVKVRPAAPRLVLPAPASWEPDDPAWLVSVRYYHDAGRLVRDVGPTQAVAFGISGFSAELLANGNVKLSVSVPDGGAVDTLATEVFVGSMR